MSPPIETSLFFSRSEMDLYDQTVDLAAPHYRLMHDVVMAVVTKSLRKAAKAEVDVLDLGSGTGFTTEALLQRFPSIRAVAMDSSPLANDMLHRKLVQSFGEPGPCGRWEVLEVDIIAAARERSEPRNWCRPDRRSSGFAGVVTSLTLHHFGREGTRDTYGMIARALEPGGFFVNADFFDFSPTDAGAFDFSAYGQEVTRQWIMDGFDRPPSQRGGARLDHDTRQSLKRSWLRHIDEEHHLLPLDLHVEMLSDLGFVSVACPFRYWQSAVICATLGG